MIDRRQLETKQEDLAKSLATDQAMFEETVLQERNSGPSLKALSTRHDHPKVALSLKALSTRHHHPKGSFSLKALSTRHHYPNGPLSLKKLTGSKPVEVQEC